VPRLRGPSLFEPTDSAAPIAVAQVVVERGVDRYPNGLTYAVPPTLSDLAPGERVIVPLGAGDRPASGYVIEVVKPIEGAWLPGAAPARRLKPVRSRDAAAHRLPAALLSLARWMSAYYITPLGMVLASMLPASVKKDVGRVTRTFIDLAAAPPAPGAPPARRSRQQRAVLAAIESLPTERRPIEMRALIDAANLRTSAAIRALVRQGVLAATKRTEVEADWIDATVDRFIPDRLTEEQSCTLEGIGAVLEVGFSTHLIHGVTGSGKTEVYIRLIERVAARGKVSLMLVPEIALTPQTGGRLIGRFPHRRVAVLHSGLTAAQRNQQWTLVAEGKADVVLGARSAVFAPIPDDRLGLIIVDEEHDGSYKQDQLPRYHGRDVAIRRAQIANCPIVLGSATPSLESWWNAQAPQTAARPPADSRRPAEEFASAAPPRSTLHRMTNRVPGTSLPTVTIVDFRQQMRARKDPSRVHLIGVLLESELRRTLTAGFQAMLLLNRRGYANYLACASASCGWVMQCDQCDATMVLHRHDRASHDDGEGFVRCHHCLAEQKVPRACPLCSKTIIRFGLGTQRVEDELLAMFPDLVDGETLARVDSDSMHGAASFHGVLGRFARGDVRVLLGTQMIAKGLDFPRVRLVGVINADTAINLPDFRAAERTFQLVSQVAGRCGRGTEAGRVVVQSFQPQAVPIRFAADHDYEGFAAAELAVRRRFRLPPVTRMARIVVRHENHAEATRMATVIASRLTAFLGPTDRLRGPAPCPISRVAGKHRQQVEVFAATAGDLQRILTAARNDGLIKSDATTAVDVDPIALL